MDFPFACRAFFFQNQASSQCIGLTDNVYFYISLYSEVQPCCFIPIAFGNVRDEPLKTILERMWSHPMLNERCLQKECPMLNREFREKYIDVILPDVKLPFRI